MHATTEIRVFQNGSQDGVDRNRGSRIHLVDLNRKGLFGKRGVSTGCADRKTVLRLHVVIQRGRQRHNSGV